MAFNRREARDRRHARIRRTVSGTGERPRLAVYRSLRHMYVQVIDDIHGHTLVAASTLDSALRERLKGKGTGNKDAAREVGLEIARRAKEKGITRVVFDRGGNAYHGRVAAVAEGVREGGLEV